MSSRKRKTPDARPTRAHSERGAQQKLNEPVYNIHRTYRVRCVPVELDAARLRSTLGSLTGLNSSEVRVQSLASDFDHDSNANLRTATVTFDAAPQLKGELPNTTDQRAQQWLLPLPGPKDEQLVLDCNFNGLTPLSPWENDDVHTIDLFLIHGLGSHAMGAFLADKSSYMWARDALAKRIPQLRVWTYEYNSRLADASSIATPQDWAERFRTHMRSNRRNSKANEKGLPIIYLAHSLGGIVWREAMARMKTSTHKEDRDNLRCSYGALLFGVPHQGMDTSNLMTMVEGPGSQLSVTLLDQNVGYWYTQHANHRFHEAFDFPDSRIAFFFESLKSRTVQFDECEQRWVRGNERILLVRPESATASTSGDYCYSLDADHSGLVKFNRGDPDNLVQVLEVLETFFRDAPDVIARRTGLTKYHGRTRVFESAKELGTLPPSLTGNFYGRTEILAQIQLCLLRPRQAPTDIPAFSIIGTGGVGKTQLARRFIDLNVHEFEHVIWLHSDTKEKLAYEFEHIAHRLQLVNDNVKPDEGRERVQEWLRSHEKWILVFDNVEHLPIDSLYWPSNLGIGGCVIVTSRNPAARSRPSTGHVDLNCFSESEATDLFFRQTGLFGSCDDQSRELARRMAFDRLRGHPLFMSHVAGFMLANDYSLETLIEEYDANEKEVIDCDESTEPDYYYKERAAATVWTLAISSLKRPARKLLDLFAVLDPDGIPLELLNAITNGELETTTDVSSQKRALKQLMQQSLVKWQNETSVIH